MYCINSQEASTSCGSSLLKMHMEGPWEIMRGFSVSNCGTVMTTVSNSTREFSGISSSGALEPIQVAPAVESTAKMHWPALRKLAG